jgi:hypothetical protein
MIDRVNGFMVQRDARYLGDTFELIINPNEAYQPNTLGALQCDSFLIEKGAVNFLGGAAS